MKAWLDNCSLHAPEEGKILEVLENFFKVGAKVGLFLSSKSSCYLRNNSQVVGLDIVIKVDTGWIQYAKRP